jgi:hypothetical protein
MPLCHRHQLQYLSAHVVGESPKCRGSTRDCASDDSRQQPCSGSGRTAEPKCNTTAASQFRCEICKEVTSSPSHWFVIRCSNTELTAGESSSANAVSLRLIVAVTVHCCREILRVKPHGSIKHKQLQWRLDLKRRDSP